MLKKFPWKPVVLTLLAWMLFWEVKETITGERMLFIYRWAYSAMDHTNDIEILTYLLTDEQVAHMLTHPDEEVRQPSNKELRDVNLNAVMRFRNLKGGIAYGTVLWGIDKAVRELYIDDIPTPREPKKYGNVIISLGKIWHEDNELPPDPIIVKWKELYIYR